MLKFSGTCLKMKILRNFLIVHFFLKIFFKKFFFKILTHASMGDCFFSMRHLCPPPQEPECHLARRQIVFICNLCVSGIVVLGGGGQSSHFYINVNFGET